MPARSRTRCWGAARTERKRARAGGTGSATGRLRRWRVAAATTGRTCRRRDVVGGLADGRPCDNRHGAVRGFMLVVQRTVFVTLVVCAVLLLLDGFRAGAHVFKAVAMLDTEISSAELLDDCGYDRSGLRVLRAPTATCVDFLREHIHLASTLGNVAALQDVYTGGQVCVAELLARPDEELVRTYAGWAAKERHTGSYRRPAQLLIRSALMEHYRCPRRDRQRA